MPFVRKIWALAGPYFASEERIRARLMLAGILVLTLLQIAVQIRQNAARNPQAMYRDPLTVEDVVGSRVICSPLHKLDCCIRSDGGGAVVLVSEERARDLPKEPVWILGAGEALSHHTMSEWEDFTESPAVHSAKRAFEYRMSPRAVRVTAPSCICSTRFRYGSSALCSV